MFSDKKRYGQDGNSVIRSKDATFNKPLSWHKQITSETPLTDRLVFTASWSDWFIEENDQHRADAWKIIRDTPNLTYQILTKRADRIKQCLPEDWADGYPNVWLGVSVENQRRADERIPLLLDVPAKIRFLSCEPLLEKVDLSRWLAHEYISQQGQSYAKARYGAWDTSEGEEPPCRICGVMTNSLHHPAATSCLSWVIVGGESGSKARGCDLNWIRSLVRQCQPADVKVFVKQLGKRSFTAVGNGTAESPYRRNYLALQNKKGGDWDEFPEDLRIRQMPV